MSYYDYYQPEAYVPKTDTYIEGLLHQRADRPHAPFGDASMLTPGRHRRRLGQLHHGIGSVSYSEMVIRLHAGERVSQRISSELVALQYQRGDIDFRRSAFRVRGDAIDLFPAREDAAWRISFSAARSKPSAG